MMTQDPALLRMTRDPAFAYVVVAVFSEDTEWTGTQVSADKLTLLCGECPTG